MLELTKLTNDQKDLIEKNYPEVRRILLSIFLNRKKPLYHFKDSPIQSLDNALSFLPDVSMEWKEERAKKTTFAKFAAQRCVLRLIDEYRKLNKFIRVNKHKKNLINKFKKEMFREDGFIDNDKLEEYIKIIGVEPDNYENNIKQFPIDKFINKVSVTDESFDEIDWVDLRDGIVKLANKYFDNSENDENAVYLVLIKDHLIPKSQNQQYKTLGQIGKEVYLSESRLSQMIRSSKMKDFFKIALNKQEINE